MSTFEIEILDRLARIEASLTSHIEYHNKLNQAWWKTLGLIIGLTGVINALWKVWL